MRWPEQNLRGREAPFATHRCKGAQGLLGTRPVQFEPHRSRRYVSDATDDHRIWQPAVMSLGQVLLIARFAGDVGELKAAYDRAHDLIMRRGGAVPIGELRHHCAASDDSLYVIGVWESEEALRARWTSSEFKELLTSVGLPPVPTEFTVLTLHAIEPPLA